MIDPQLLADIRFFELLDQEDRQELAKLVDQYHLKQGLRAFETGDRDTGPRTGFELSAAAV